MTKGYVERAPQGPMTIRRGPNGRTTHHRGDGLQPVIALWADSLALVLRVAV